MRIVIPKKELRHGSYRFPCVRLTAVADGAEISNVEEQAKFFRDTVKTTMDALRAPADKLEMIVDKEYWPFPSYGDLMFEV